MKEEFLVFVYGVFVFVAVVLGISAAMFGIVALAENYQCNGYAEATGKATQYTHMECYVQDEGKWYSMPEYKNRLVTKGSM